MSRAEKDVPVGWVRIAIPFPGLLPNWLRLVALALGTLPADADATRASRRLEDASSQAQITTNDRACDVSRQLYQAKAPANSFPRLLIGLHAELR